DRKNPREKFCAGVVFSAHSRDGARKRWTWSIACVSLGMVQAASLKTLELISPSAVLTPCILDDDQGQLELMTELVAGAGFEAVATADPEEALQLVRSGRSRLILADVHMPGIDGYEFLERAIKADPGAHIILMTGDYTLESALEAIRKGAADFLPKPV